jgi:hypothetical protein
MTEQQYADIAAACDRLLRKPGTSLARLAVPALHFLNEHPSSLAQYAPVLNAHPGGDLFCVPRALVRAARGLTRSLAARRPAPHERGPVDVVIVSHLLKPEQLERDDDFYFGAMQSQLQALGATSLLVLISHLRPDRGALDARLPRHPRVILPATVLPATEADIWRRCASAWRALRREAASARDGADRRLATLASRHALSASAVRNLRMHAALADVLQDLKPKIVITTYEGTVAERLIWHAARTTARRPLCVGYQHAMVLKRAHAIRRAVAAFGIDCDPDIVLTLGALSHAALAASAGLKSVRFIEYGSHRRLTLPALPPPRDRPRHCLVLPDAGDQECATLFEFALRCADHSPQISFILRPHPLVDTQRLLQRSPALRNLPGNVSLSLDRPLEQEFAQARYCLYRGSSAALYAARAGIRPYYVAQPGELPFDCLFALAGWRETVTSPEQLADRIRLAESSTDPAAAGSAAEICERYVSPLRPAALRELLAMVPS